MPKVQGYDTGSINKDPIGTCEHCGADKYKEDLLTGQQVVWCENGHYTISWHTIKRYVDQVNEYMVEYEGERILTGTGFKLDPVKMSVGKKRKSLTKERFEESDFTEDDVVFTFSTSDREVIPPDKVGEFDKENLYHRHSGFGNHDLDRNHRLKTDKEGRRWENVDQFLSHLENPKQVESL